LDHRFETTWSLPSTSGNRFTQSLPSGRNQDLSIHQDKDFFDSNLPAEQRSFLEVGEAFIEFDSLHSGGLE
jgi:hypothetical protein